MKKTITNDEILDAVYDIADAQGVRIDEFIARLQEDYAELPAKYAEGDLPEDVLAELQSAKEMRREMRDSKRKSDEDAKLREEIAAFRELFPEVKPEEIPEEVWAEVADGTDLRHAYALHVLTGQQSEGHAEEVNRETASRAEGAAAAAGDGSTEPSFTPEQVERMSAKDVAKNYKNVLRSLKNWR